MLKNPILSGLLVIIVLLGPNLVGWARPAISTDKELASYLEQNRDAFSGIMSFARDHDVYFGDIDFRVASEADPKRQELRTAVLRLIGADSPVELIEFRRQYLKVYVSITGLVGVTSTFKGLIGFYDRNPCDVSSDETDEEARRRLQQETSRSEITVYKRLDDQWCIFYSIEVD